jgi:tyrosine-protein kinase Etk/Wzc
MLTTQPLQQHPDYLELHTITKFLLEKKWQIILISLIFLSLFFAYAYSRPIVYQGSLLLRVQNHHEIFKKIDQTIADESIATQISLIRSKVILEPVITQLNLDLNITPKNNLEVKEFIIPDRFYKKKINVEIDNSGHFTLSTNKKVLLTGEIKHKVIANGFTVLLNARTLPFTGSLVKYPRKDILNQLRNRITVNDLSASLESMSPTPAILQLVLNDKDGENLTQILNAIATEAKSKDTERKIFQADKWLHFLNQQLPIVQNNLYQAESKLIKYRDKSGKIDVKLQTQYFLTQLTDLDKQLSDVRIKKMNMLEQYTPYHPFLIALTQNEKELQHQREVVSAELKKLPASDQTTIHLERDLDVKKDLYFNLLSQIHELEILKEGIVSDINILSKATIDAATSKNFTFIIIGGFIISFLISIVLNVLFRLFNNKVMDPYWTEKIFSIPYVTSVPQGKNLKVNFAANQKTADDLNDALHSLRAFISYNHPSKNGCIKISFLKFAQAADNFALQFANLLAKKGHSVALIDVSGEAAVPKTTMTSLTNLTHLFVSHEKLDSFLENSNQNFQYVIINSTNKSSFEEHLDIATSSDINFIILQANRHKPTKLYDALKKRLQAGIHFKGVLFTH